MVNMFLCNLQYGSSCRHPHWDRAINNEKKKSNGQVLLYSPLLSYLTFICLMLTYIIKLFACMYCYYPLLLAYFHFFTRRFSNLWLFSFQLRVASHPLALLKPVRLTTAQPCHSLSSHPKGFFHSQLKPLVVGSLLTQPFIPVYSPHQGGAGEVDVRLYSVLLILLSKLPLLLLPLLSSLL